MDDLHFSGRRPPMPSRSRVLQYLREALVEGVSEADVMSGKRLDRKGTAVRWAVIARLRAEGSSLPGIGQSLNLDHSTVKLALIRMRHGLIPYQHTGEKIAALRRRVTPRGAFAPRVPRPKPPVLIRYAGYDRTERDLDWR